MNTDAVFNVVVSTVSLLAFWVLVFRIYGDFAVERFRQEMFAIRDVLFDNAAAGLVGFDHPAYALLRDTINGLIRFGHRIGIIEALLSYWVVRARVATEPVFSEAWEKASLTLSVDQWSALDDTRTKMSVALAKHVVIGSPFALVTLVLPLLGFFAIQMGLGRAKSWLRTPIDNIESSAWSTRQRAA